ncbi:MAG: MFS transporter, partial [Prevotella sp.]
MMKKKTGWFIPATLGMLTAFGPFVTDFYLPVLPEMTEYFKTTPSMISMSLTSGMMGLAAGQIFIGPLTDKYGRKNILVVSMLLFAVASVLCILTTDILMF